MRESKSKPESAEGAEVTISSQRLGLQPGKDYSQRRRRAEIEAQARGTEPIPSAPNALSGFDIESPRDSLTSLRRGTPVRGPLSGEQLSSANPLRRGGGAEHGTDTSAPSALSGFHFDSLLTRYSLRRGTPVRGPLCGER